MILAGETAYLNCYSSQYTPPHWLFYPLTPQATPCAFDSSVLHTGVSLCSAVPRISVTYSSQQRNKTTLTIFRTELGDAGTYTCGSNDPNSLNGTSSIIVGVIGKRTPGLHSDTIRWNILTCAEKLIASLVCRTEQKNYCKNKLEGQCHDYIS